MAYICFMKKQLIWTLSLLLVASCGETIEDPIATTEKNKEVSDDGPLDERAKRHVESSLGISATEKYTLEIYRENLDGDDKEDAIITVNRLQFAIDEAIQNGNVAKRAELAYMGNYNYIFFFDGGLNKISPPIALPSTPQKSLKIAFEHISSAKYKDILVDFRIRNSSFKDIYTVSNHTPRRIFQWKNFDGLGSTSKEAYVFEFKPSSKGPQKEILIYGATFTDPKDNFDPLTYEPILKPSTLLEQRFFYLPQEGKYATEKN
jgi:hypothetical protein